MGDVYRLGEDFFCVLFGKYEVHINDEDSAVVIFEHIARANVGDGYFAIR